MKYSKADQSSVKQEQALDQLSWILHLLSTKIPSFDPRHAKQLLTNKPALTNLATEGKSILREQCGFSLAVQPSLLQGGGSGVFMDSGGVKRGQLVALYPGEQGAKAVLSVFYIMSVPFLLGTVYLPFEPLLLPSLRNSFIFRCIDGIHIDGKHRGLSGMIYRWVEHWGV